MTQSPSSITEALSDFCWNRIFSLLTSTEHRSHYDFRVSTLLLVVIFQKEMWEMLGMFCTSTLAVSKHIPFKKDSKVANLTAPAVFEMAILSSLLDRTIIARRMWS